VIVKFSVVLFTSNQFQKQLRHEARYADAVHPLSATVNPTDVDSESGTAGVVDSFVDSIASSPSTVFGTPICFVSVHFVFGPNRIPPALDWQSTKPISFADVIQ
jgi:hypothetical protein